MHAVRREITFRNVKLWHCCVTLVIKKPSSSEKHTAPFKRFASYSADKINEKLGKSTPIKTIKWFQIC